MIGGGVAYTVGGVTNPSFNAGFAGAGTFAMQTTTYAAQGAENGMRGVAFTSSTVGYNNIQLTYNHRHSNTSSSSNGVDYSLDGGGTWTRIANFSFVPAATGTGDTWYSRSVDFSSVAGVAENFNFQVRVVATFATATGYLASRSTSTYLTTGTYRFDDVQFTGDVVPEPATMAVLGLGAAAMLRRRKK